MELRKEEATAHLERELEAVFFSLRKDITAAKAEALKVLNEDPAADLVALAAYFTGQGFPPEEARELWRVVSAYRGGLFEQFGQRVSMHIAFYQYTRDPEAREGFRPDLVLRCTRRAQRLAFLEMRGWWERNSETGLFREDLMAGRLEAELRAAARSRTPTSFLLIELQPPARSARRADRRALAQVREKLLQELAEHVMDAVRSSDIVGHDKLGSLALILPRTDGPGALVLARRLRQALLGRSTPERPFTLEIAAASVPRDAWTGRDLIRVAQDAIRRGPPAEDAVRVARFRRGGPGYRLRIQLLPPACAMARDPRFLVPFLCLLLAGAWFHKELLGIVALEETWKVATSLSLNRDDLVPGWEMVREGGRTPLRAGDPCLHKGGMLVLDGGGAGYALARLDLEGRTRLAMDLRLPGRGVFRMRITSPGRDLALELVLSRRSLELRVPPFLLASEELDLPRQAVRVVLERDGPRLRLRLDDGPFRELEIPGRMLPLSAVRLENAGGGRVHLLSFVLERSSFAARGAEPRAPVLLAHGRLKEAVARRDEAGALKAVAELEALDCPGWSLLLGDVRNQPGGEEHGRALEGFLPRLDRALLAAGRRPMSARVADLEEKLGREEALLLLLRVASLPGLGEEDAADLAARRALLASSAAELRQVLARAFPPGPRRARVLEAAMTRAGLLPPPESSVLWRELYAMDAALPRAGLFRAARLYLERFAAGGRQDGPELLAPSAVAVMREWEEDPEEAVDLLRRALAGLPVEERRALLLAGGHATDTSLAGDLLLARDLLAGDPEDVILAHQLLVKYLDFVDQRRSLLPEWLCLHAATSLRTGYQDVARQALERLRDLREPGWSSWAAQALSTLSRSGAALEPWDPLSARGPEAEGRKRGQ